MSVDTLLSVARELVIEMENAGFRIVDGTPKELPPDQSLIDMKGVSEIRRERILGVDEIITNQEALNHLFSWAIQDIIFPESD